MAVPPLSWAVSIPHCPFLYLTIQIIVLFSHNKKINLTIDVFNSTLAGKL
jgi:hypothetical protein